MTRRVSLTVCALAALLAFACSPTRYVDDDKSCSRAKPLPPTIVLKDEINVNRGDRTDCKEIRYFKNALAKVVYRVGTAFEKHNIKGVITIYNVDGQIIDQRPVDPSLPKYEFEFEVKAQQPYFVEFKANQGAHGYSAQVAFQKVDPCARCRANEKCLNNQCVPDTACNPQCDEEQRCDAGRCVSLCDPPCASNRECNARTRTCIKTSRACRPSCKRGQYCRRGRCKKKRANCPGGCASGLVCRSGKCVKASKKCPPCPNPTDVCSAETRFKCMSIGDGPKKGPIVGRITSVIRAGSGTIVYVNRGDRHGAKRNQRARLCGRHRAVVTGVYPTRCKLKSTASIEELGDCKRVVISR